METFISVILGSLLSGSFVSAIVGWMLNNQARKAEFTNAKNMQISSYYREISGKDMQRILNEWTELFFLTGTEEFKNSKHNNPKYLIKLLKDTYLYSSPETCERLTNYQAYNYTIDQNGVSDHYKTLVLVAGIIVSLKHDFTGEWITVESTLKLKLNDYADHDKGFKKVISQFNY